MFRLTALKSFSRAAVFAIEAIDLRCCSSWNDTLYFPLCLCAHFFATIVTNALSSLNHHSIRIEKMSEYDENWTVQYWTPSAQNHFRSPFGSP